jgi:hypothetical protein
VTLSPLPFDLVGTPLGAAYKPLDEMNPTAWLPPAIPSTSQVTAVLGAPFTDAVNCCAPKSATVAALGETVTVLATAAVTVTVADPDLGEFACEVAMTLTVAGFGTVDGAVYSPPLEIVPFDAPPLTLQVTAMFDVPVTVAVNCSVFPVATLALAGATETVIVLVGVWLAVPAQPYNATQAQLIAPSTKRRIEILTGGAGSHSKRRQTPRQTIARICP